MVIFPPAPDQTIAQMWSNGLWGEIAAEWSVVAQWSQWGAYKETKIALLNGTIHDPHDLPFPENGGSQMHPRDMSNSEWPYLRNGLEFSGSADRMVPFAVSSSIKSRMSAGRQWQITATSTRCLSDSTALLFNVAKTLIENFHVKNLFKWSNRRDSLLGAWNVSL